jgi:hypothetical protein
MGTVISRVGYCGLCASQGRPHKGSLFLVHGTYRDAYYVREAMRDGIRGYVPMTYILQKVCRDGTCVVHFACGMHGCGVEYDSQKRSYSVNMMSWKVCHISISDWNALVGYRRDAQYQV